MNDDATLDVMMALCGGPDDQGGEAQFVGGCVRDAILNRATTDIDIATVWTPDVVIARLEAAKIKAIPTGLQHGTITAVQDGKPFEITTLRRDLETDGRHAEVAFTDKWREDAARRDLTMNALYATVRGEVTDFFGGLEDAKNGVIRFIGDAETRIQEDYLRILRLYRFYAHYAKAELGEKERSAVRAHVSNLSSISVERIQHEFIRLLMSDDAPVTLDMMREDGVFDVILKGIGDTALLSGLIELEGVFDGKAAPMRRLAALCQLDSDVAKDIGTYLKLSNHDAELLITLCDGRDHYSDGLSDQEMRVLIYRHGVDHVRSWVLLDSAAIGLTREDIAATYDMVTRTRLPDLPICGEDVIKKGVKKGPNVGKALAAVEQWWVESDFEQGRTACLKKLSEVVKDMN